MNIFHKIKLYFVKLQYLLLFVRIVRILVYLTLSICR